MSTFLVPTRSSIFSLNLPPAAIPSTPFWYTVCPAGENTLCTSCEEYFNKTCKKNSGVCQPRYPDLACQTKEVYFQRGTGGEVKARGGEGWKTDFKTWLREEKSTAFGIIYAWPISIVIDLDGGLGHVPSILNSRFSSIRFGFKGGLQTSNLFLFSVT